MTPIETLQELARLQKIISEAEARKGEITIEGCFANCNEKELVAEFSELTDTIEGSQTKIKELLQPYYETVSA